MWVAVAQFKLCGRLIRVVWPYMVDLDREQRVE